MSAEVRKSFCTADTLCGDLFLMAWALETILLTGSFETATVSGLVAYHWQSWKDVRVASSSEPWHAARWWVSVYRLPVLTVPGRRSRFIYK